MHGPHQSTTHSSEVRVQSSHAPLLIFQTHESYSLISLFHSIIVYLSLLCDLLCSYHVNANRLCPTHTQTEMSNAMNNELMSIHPKLIIEPNINCLVWYIITLIHLHWFVRVQVSYGFPLWRLNTNMEQRP